MKKWTIEGSLNLREALMKELGLSPMSIQTKGYIYFSSYESGDDQGYENRYQGSGFKENNHFKLPEQWNEALEFITSNQNVKYKVGDWVITDGYGDKYDGIPLRINNILKGSGSLNYDYCYFDQSQNKSHNFTTNYITRLATHEEIKSELIKQAKEKGFDNSDQEYENRPIVQGLNYGGHLGSFWKYDIKEDLLYTSGTGIVHVYQKGKWATIIKQAGIKSLYFGKVEFIIHRDEKYAKTKYGNISKKDIDNAINWLENSPSLGNYKFTIHDNSENNNITLSRIGFGCEEGTYQELKAIQLAFN